MDDLIPQDIQPVEHEAEDAGGVPVLKRLRERPCCESAWGSDADRRRRSLKSHIQKGSHTDADSHCQYQEWDALPLAHRAEQAAAEIRLRLPVYRLQQALADPDWYETPKGERFETPGGDVVQTFRRYDGLIGFGYQVEGGNMHWSRGGHGTWGSAGSAGILKLTAALSKAGRLPRR